MRIFVTGAAGFVGSHFVAHATAAGHDVIALCRNERPPGDAFARAEGPRVVVRQGDLLDRDSLVRATSGAECICHFAAAFREAADEAYFQQVNVTGTRNLLAAAHANGARRFVFCSTAGIHGRQAPGLIDESSPLQPWNAYERSKADAENEVRRATGAFGMEYVILRPTAVYGPGDKRLLKLYRSASRGRFPLFGKGEGRRHMVHVSDLAEAFLLACTSPAAAGQEMIVGGPEVVPLRELLQILAALNNRRSCGPQLPLRPMLALAALTEDLCRRVGIQPPLHRRRMDFYISDAEFDCTRARTVLGWEPRIRLREGLADTLRADPVASARIGQPRALGR